jgi:hypothetical protein
MNCHPCVRNGLVFIGAGGRQVDMSTVDSRVRALALGVTAMQDREDHKASASLAEIQGAYFGLLHNTFGHIYKLMGEQRLNPDTAGVAASRDSDFVAQVSKMVPEFMENLVEFWLNAGAAAHIHIEDAGTVKAVFGGDFFPSAYQNIASTCGVYLDTIVLPDPLLRSKQMFRYWAPERQTHYFVKHALNVLQYRDLALADVPVPIVAIPDRPLLDDQAFMVMDHVAKADVVLHANTVFGRSFQVYEEVLSFLDSFHESDDLVRQIVRPDRVLFNLDWTGSIPEQLHRMAAEQPEARTLAPTPSRLIALQAYGRMAQSNDLLIRSQRLRDTPLIDAPTSWRYFQWKLEYDSSRLPDSTLPDLHILRALQAAGAAGKPRWIGRVPPEALIELRKKDMLPELRQLIGEGIGQLSSSAPMDFGRTADVVVKNIEAAFAEQERKLAELATGKWKFAFKDVGTWLVYRKHRGRRCSNGNAAVRPCSNRRQSIVGRSKIERSSGRIEDSPREGKTAQQLASRHAV